jgi:hypothetical protein
MKKITIGHIAVDSGQVLIVDPCYLSEWKDGEYKEGNLDNHYSQACNISYKDGYGEIVVSGTGGVGIVSKTYCGDGVYPVIAHVDTDGGIKKLEVIFE